jgi:hypothetical protein
VRLEDFLSSISTKHSKSWRQVLTSQDGVALAQPLLTADSACCCCSGLHRGHLPDLADPSPTRHIATFFSRRAVKVSMNTLSGYAVCCEFFETISSYVKSAKGNTDYITGFLALFY